jgi:hypothetical protein
LWGRSRHAAAVTVRLLGIDLGITSDHTAVVSTTPAMFVPVVVPAPRWPAWPRSTPPIRAPGLVVVVEPTGPAWLPVAVFLGRRGHTVLR